MLQCNTPIPLGYTPTAQAHPKLPPPHFREFMLCAGAEVSAHHGSPGIFGSIEPFFRVCGYLIVDNRVLEDAMIPTSFLAPEYVRAGSGHKWPCRLYVAVSQGVRGLLLRFRQAAEPFMGFGSIRPRPPRIDMGSQRTPT